MNTVVRMIQHMLAPPRNDAADRYTYRYTKACRFIARQTNGKATTGTSATTKYTIYDAVQLDSTRVFGGLSVNKLALLSPRSASLGFLFPFSTLHGESPLLHAADELNNFRIASRFGWEFDVLKASQLPNIKGHISCGNNFQGRKSRIPQSLLPPAALPRGYFSSRKGRCCPRVRRSPPVSSPSIGEVFLVENIVALPAGAANLR